MQVVRERGKGREGGGGRKERGLVILYHLGEIECHAHTGSGRGVKISVSVKR